MTAESEQMESNIPVLYYSDIRGQNTLKTALEIAYITGPRIGGVLISGERGTGKSTIVRSFSKMMFDVLPVTLPINATEDRVVGGWDIKAIMAGEAKQRKGLLKEANGKILYIDEVNLLDDHIVNIILDTTATGILSVQRQGIDIPATKTEFILIGTMNPDEGFLRPQLLDRFGLMVSVITEPEQRANILDTVLKFDMKLTEIEKSDIKLKEYNEGHKTQSDREKLKRARENLSKTLIKGPLIKKCVELAENFNAIGHRAERYLALAARAMAALEATETMNGNQKKIEVGLNHLAMVSRMALEHRGKDKRRWSGEDNKDVLNILGLPENTLS
ncbi:magnesium chelatase [Candidatus Magnetomorum sp. HK-1]|nr:magnesium chelatase [Candidatus Magnetomorum sp. HK-1]